MSYTHAQIFRRANTIRYAGSFARRFNANLNETDLDFKRKVAAFLAYAEYDQHMVGSCHEVVSVVLAKS